MRTPLLILSTAALTLLAASLLAPSAERPSVASGLTHTAAIVGDPDVVIEAYAQWKADFEAGPHVVEIGLTRAMSHVDRRQGLRGTFSIDLDDASAVVRVESTCLDLEAWLVANVDASQPGMTAPQKGFMPEPGDVCRRLGSLRTIGEDAELVVDLSGPEWRDIALDTIAVTRAGVRPEVESLLVGQSNVFERLYGRELAAARPEDVPTFGTGLPLALIAMPMVACGAFSAERQIRALVDQGEKLFFRATFGGNGRTCGTCHPAENNLTLDPAFIATMPPHDPLFVAEFDPKLDSNQNGGLMFEQPALMHQFALILENLDGFDDLQQRFVMRSVSHTFAQDMQRLKPVVGVNPPRQRLGWGGDGAPGSGTLRDFAIGAVTQHFTRTMTRIPGVDFNLPSGNDLDSFEAFQLALGRQQEYELQNVTSTAFIAFTDISVEQGKQSFLGSGCGLCHENAGAKSGFTTQNGVVVPADPNNFVQANGNFDTGVERFLIANPDGTGLPRPIDGGFGTQPQGMPLPGGPFDPIQNLDGSFGDMSFNTPSLVEFADTVPAFHNNITASTPLDSDPVAAAVAFYTTPAFANSSGGQFFPQPTFMTPVDIKKIALFLRGINAVQNERNARRFLWRALGLAFTDFASYEPIILRGMKLADAEVEDAQQQCTAAAINPSPIPRLQGARNSILDVQNTSLSIAARILAIQTAIQRLVDAEDVLLL